MGCTLYTEQASDHPWAKPGIAVSLMDEPESERTIENWTDVRKIGRTKQQIRWDGKEHFMEVISEKVSSSWDDTRM